MDNHKKFEKTYKQISTANKKQLGFSVKGKLKVACWQFDKRVGNKNKYDELVSESQNDELAFLICKQDKHIWLSANEIRDLKELVEKVNDSAMDNIMIG